MEKQASTMLQLVRDRAAETAQAKGEVLQRGEGKGINPLPRDWEGRDLFMNLNTGHLHALRHKASVDFKDFYKALRIQ